MSGLIPRLALGGVLGLLGASLAFVPASATPGPEACEGTAVDDDPGSTIRSPSTPVDQLGIARFQKAITDLRAQPGRGVTVAVVDSGVEPVPQLRSAGSDPRPVGGVLSSAPVYYHGTAVASLIAGAPLPNGKPVGIAPYARIYDERVYDNDVEVQGEPHYQLVEPDVVAEGLEHLAQLVSRHQAGIDIVNVSLGMNPSDRLRAAVNRLTDLGVVVVASTGNRPMEAGEFPDGFEAFRPGEDAAGAVFPAGYATDDGLVVAVNSTVPEGSPTDHVLLNSATDVAAPSGVAGSDASVAYALNRVSCLLPTDPATSFSAAEVSGILAALMSVYRNDTPQQVVARLEATATGLPTAVGVATDKLTGFGVVQPLEALQRPLDIEKDGTVVRSQAPASQAHPATLPEPAPDVLRSTRRRALWWGLGGGGALLIAVMLRPVFSRRRG